MAAGVEGGVVVDCRSNLAVLFFIGRRWTLDVPWKVPRAMHNAPHENTVFLGKWFVENGVAEHSDLPWAACVLGSLTMEERPLCRSIHRLKHTGKDRVGDFKPRFTGKIIPDVVQVAASARGADNARGSHWPGV